jgi:hypothetical protein
MALINPLTSVGVNGQVAPNTSNVNGFNNNQAGTQQVSQNTPLPTQDQAIALAQTTDGSISTFISGDPNGDFAGVNILEQVVTDGTGLFLNTRTQNPVKTDLNNATVLSDAPPSTILTLTPNVPQVIDTTGYQTVVFQQIAATAVTVTHSNDGATFATVLGIPLSATGGTFSSATAATANLISAYPVAARYMRFSAAAATQVIIYLRQQPFSSFVGFGNSTVTVSGTATISGAVTASGTIAVGTAASANPVPMGGFDGTGLTRRFLTDTAGQLQTDVNNQLYNGAIYTEQFLPLRVEQIHTNRGQDSLQDLLTQILVELKTLNYYTRETPNSINLMLQQSSLAGFMPSSMQDEQEQFFSDSTLFNLSKGQ